MRKFPILLILSISCLWSCRAGKRSTQKVPLLEIIAYDILKESESYYNSSFYLEDSTSTKRMCWSGYIPEEVLSTIGFDTFNELLVSLESRNAVEQRIIKNEENSDFKGPPYLTVSNFGISKNRKYIMIYVEVYFGPLSAEGQLKIFELKEGRLIFPEKLAIKLWVS